MRMILPDLSNVADFLLKQTTDNTYLRKMPMVSD